MGISAKLDKLKDKLKDFIEEKTWYADGNPILDIAELDLKIRLALFLIDLLDGKSDRVKNTVKLKADQQAIDEKEKERQLFEEQEEELKRRYKEWIEEQTAEADLSCGNKNNMHSFVFVPFYSMYYPQGSFKLKPVPVALENDIEVTSPSKRKNSIH